MELNDLCFFCWARSYHCPVLVPILCENAGFWSPHFVRATCPRLAMQFSSIILLCLWMVALMCALSFYPSKTILCHFSIDTIAFYLKSTQLDFMRLFVVKLISHYTHTPHGGLTGYSSRSISSSLRLWVVPLFGFTGGDEKETGRHQETRWE